MREVLLAVRTGSESDPFTCSVEFGAVVRMPTLVSEDAPFCPLMDPSTRLLLAVTRALEPTAVALVMPATPLVESPRNELKLSVVLLPPVLPPMNALLEPVVLLIPETLPMAVLPSPRVLNWPDPAPKKVLWLALVWLPALMPKNEFWLPTRLV